MSDLREGKYRIVLAVPSPPEPVGVNHKGGHTVPVVVGGKDNIWTVRKVKHRKYTLTLEQTGHHWFSQAVGIGSSIEASTSLPPTEWSLERQKDGSYLIHVFTGTTITWGWTLDDPEPGTEVRYLLTEVPQPGQFWNFHHVHDE